MSAPARTVSERGFTHMETITPRHGGWVRAYESSLATDAHVWLSVKGSAEQDAATVSLSLKQVRALERQLRWLRKNHYQVRKP